MASQITGVSIVYSTLDSGADQRKHQSSVALAFVRGIHWWPVNSLHKRSLTRKMFPCTHVSVPSLTFMLNSEISTHEWLGCLFVSVGLLVWWGMYQRTGLLTDTTDQSRILIMDPPLTRHMIIFKVPEWKFRMNSAGNILRYPPYGTLMGGATLVSGGQFAASLYVDGSSTGQYVDFGTPSGECLYEPDLCENGVTVGFWLKYSTILAEGEIGYIIDSGSSDANSVGISFGRTDTRFFIKINLKECSYHYESRVFSMMNTWQFVTFVFSSGDGLSLYINGCDTQASRVPTIGDYVVREVPIPANSPPSPFRIGGHDDHKDEMSLDHLHIWYEVLQPDEIWHLFTYVGSWS